MVYIENVLKKFHSKKNEVYLISEAGVEFVLKTADSLDKEFYILDKLQNILTVPGIIEYREKSLKLEYIDGVTVLEWLELAEKRADQIDGHLFIFDELIDWLDKFHSIFNHEYIFGDVNLRNFIIRDKTIYGIDFEDASIGRIEEDLGKLLAFLITYDPINSNWKKELVRGVYLLMHRKERFQLNQVVDEYYKELERIINRRGLKVDIGELSL